MGKSSETAVCCDLDNTLRHRRSVYPRAFDFLQEQRQRGHRLVLTTASSPDLVEDSWGNHFDHILTSDDFPEGMNTLKDLTCVRQRLSPENPDGVKMVMIGDPMEMYYSRYDIQTPFFIVPYDGGWLTRERTPLLCDAFLTATPQNPGDYFDDFWRSGVTVPFDFKGRFHLMPTSVPEVRRCLINGEAFLLAVTAEEGRLVLENPALL